MATPSSGFVQRTAVAATSRRGALVVLLAIITAFLAFGVYWGLSHPEQFLKPTGDGVNYEVMVKQLLKRGVYAYRETTPNAAVTPGYPLFLAGMYWATGRTNRPMRAGGGPYRLIYWIQLLFAAGAIALTYLIGSELLGRGPGLIAAAMFAAYPPTQQSAIKLLTEPLAVLLLLGYLYLQLLAMRRDRKTLWVAAGVVFGAAVMVRPAFLVIGVVPLLYLLATERRWRHWFVQACLLGLGFAIIVSPWVIRNTVTLGHPILLRSGSSTGEPMLAGVDPYHWEAGWKYRYSGPTYQEYYAVRGASRGPYAPPFDLDQEQYALRAIRVMFLKNPAATIEWFTIGKTRAMFTRPWEGGDGGPMLSITWIVQFAIVAFGFMGMVLAFKEERFRLLSLIVVVGVATLLPFVPEPRFVFGFLPLLAVLGAGVMYRAWTLLPYGSPPSPEPLSP